MKAASVKHEVKKESARDKIDSILKKREKKMESKANQQQFGAKKFLTQEDTKIMADIKNKKRDDRRKRNREELEGDEFDGFLDKYKSKLMKKIGQIETAGESGATF
jgi:hypothetical protein